MTCPVCGGDNLVTYSFKDCEAIYRERTCKECEHVFYTAECEFDVKAYNKLLYQRNHKYYLRRRAKT